MKILLTGGTGFVGSELLHLLVKSGKQVILLKRSTSGVERIASILPHIQYYDSDNTDLDTIFKQNKIEQIVHLATDYARDKHFTRCYESNVTFPLLLLQKGFQYDVQRFINTDSFSSLVENLNYLPAYHISKRHFKEWGTFIAKQENRTFITTFLQHPYGPKDSDSKFISFIVNAIVNEVPHIDLTAGVQKRDFIHVRDVAAAYLALLEAVDAPKEIEIGTGQSHSIRSFVERVKKIAKNTTTQLNFGKLPTRDNEIMNSVADISAISQLGWKSATSLEDGIKELIANKRL